MGPGRIAATAVGEDGSPVPVGRLGRLVEGGRRAHMISLGGATAELALGFVSSVLTARILFPDGRGQLGRWVFCATLVVNLGVLGMGTALPQLVGAKHLSLRGAQQVASAFCLAFLPLGILVALSLFRITTVASDPWSYVGWGWISLAYVPAAMASAIAQGILIAQGRVGVMMGVRIAGTIAYVAALTAVLLSRPKAHPATLAAVLAAYAVVTSTVLFLSSRPRGPRGLPPGALALSFRRGVSNHIPTIFTVCVSLIDQGWVYTRLSDADAGLFAVANGAAAALAMIAFAETTASTVGMAEPVHGWGRVSGALRRTALLSGLGVAVGYICSPVVIPRLFGPSFSVAVAPFRILVTAVALQNVGKVIETALQSRNHPRAAWVFQIGRGTSLVCFVALFGRFYGLIGITSATAAASAVGVGGALLVLLVLRRRATIVTADGSGQ